MGNFLSIFNAKHKQKIKERILNNREAVLDIMSKNIKGARQCPFLLGQKCLGEFCELFMELKSINQETKQETKFYRCAILETPLLIIELNQSIIRLTEQLTKEQK